MHKKIQNYKSNVNKDLLIPYVKFSDSMSNYVDQAIWLADS